MLIRIVYYSERDPVVGLDLKWLNETCVRNNTRDEIGGFLHYNGYYFLQVLEGDQVAVSNCYARIEASGLHRNLVLIGAERIEARTYPAWSMGLGEGMKFPTKEMFLAHFAASRVDPVVVVRAP